MFGCSCNHVRAQRPCELLKNPTEVIFVGTVLSAENPPDPTEYRVQTGQAHYSFRVDEPMSGVTGKEIDVYSGRGCCDCSVSFQKGEKYLVDAWRGDNGLVSVSICSKTRQFRTSDPLLPELRAIRDGKRADSLFGVLRRAQEPWGGASDPKFNEPLVGRTIHLSSGEEGYEAKTDSEGNYSFSGLPAGEYSVSADLPPNLVLGEFILRSPMPPIKVAPNACGEYDLNALPTGRITGRVLAPDGNDMGGWGAEALELFRAERYKENAHEWADEGWRNFPGKDGSFIFDHVAPGDYFLVYNYDHSTRTQYPLTFTPPLRMFSTPPEFTLVTASRLGGS